MFDKLASNCSEDVTNSTQLTQKVRITLKMYKPDLCHTTLGLKAASSSFCRWLFSVSWLRSSSLAAPPSPNASNNYDGSSVDLLDTES